MKALITGASAGIGEQLARQLAARGYDLVLVARREDRLKELADSLPTHCEIIAADLNDPKQCIKVWRTAQGEDLEVVINNAGFGKYGSFAEIPLEDDISMISVNVTALHILSKLAVQDFAKKGRGYLLNVASVAGFLPGPLMATYYATKAYVLRLTQGIAEEQRQQKTGVTVSALCPGPVKTEFDQVAGVQFSLRGASAEYVAERALSRLFANKTVTIPTFSVRFMNFWRRFAPDGLVSRVIYHAQNGKGK